ncbi:MAG: hypothetical protein AB1921_20220 [Thermodesulfobacteriota bacterium]
MAKHACKEKESGPPPGQKVLDALKNKVTEGRISCADAFALARDLGCPPREAGVAADRLSVKIVRCQLGLFGYGDRPKPADEKEPLAEGLAEALRAEEKDGRLSCARAWEIAAERSLPKLSVARAANALGIRIKPCQLGAF